MTLSKLSRIFNSPKRLQKEIARAFVLIIVALLPFMSIAQQADTLPTVSPLPAVDTPPEQPEQTMLEKVREIARQGAAQSRKDFENEKKALQQERIIDEMHKTTLKAKAYLKQDVDTLEIGREINKLNAWREIAIDGVLFNKGSAHSHRNLVATLHILEELLQVTRKRKSTIDSYEKNLANFRFIIDSLDSDSVLHQLPEDSTELIQFFKKYIYVVEEMAPADSSLKAALSSVRNLQAKLNYQVYTLNANMEEIELYQSQLSNHFLSRDFPGLFSAPHSIRPFGEVVHASAQKAKLTVSFFLRHHFGKILLLLVLIVASALFLDSLKGILEKEKLLRSDFVGQLVLRYPTLSAIVLVLNLLQFIFPSPPFAVNTIIWSTTAVSMTIIFWGFITRYWMRFWLIMLALFLMACADNLVLQASRVERWGMLFLSTAGVLAGLFYLLRGHRQELREKPIVYFIALLVLFELGSTIANLYGRYNLSKVLLITGFSSVTLGILFLWTVRLINEGLRLASSVYTKQERKLFFVNFDRVGDKAPGLLYILLVVGWIILLGRNFYEYRLISEPLREFFSEERTLGSYSFTINNIFLFFLIMFLAIVISKIISFFATDKHAAHMTEAEQRKAGLGSWILLVRVAVISIGLFLALAASGFPLDRITILLGALGVGVGLGLQGLVNNLVSGLIIAFEKPVNVGDIVEVSGKVGTIKSIGFRSSIISDVSGADVIIPNGDLLNAHLVNWTLGGNKRRMDLVVGVAYGTDLDKAKQLVLDLLGKQEQVLRFPGPAVVFENFDNSSINIKVLFWVGDYREGFVVRSAVINEIHQAFGENNITIPFPQQDIHIKNNGNAG